MRPSPSPNRQVFFSPVEARAAYTREFEDVFGYPPGYNVQCMPKLDKVWPSWHEEEARLRQMADRPRMPVICQSPDAEPLSPVIQRMQKVDWLVAHAMLVFDDSAPVAWPEIAIQSRGLTWYEQTKSQGKHFVICGCAYVDADTRRIRIVIHKPGFTTRQVLLEEIYHIGLKILFYERPRLFAAIHRWYTGELANGQDPTLSIADMFASTMAIAESGARTSLPSSVVSSARRLLCATHHVPASIMQQVITSWAQPLPV